MGVRFRKSIRVGKFARINFSKSGVSTSFGIPGARISVSKRGKTFTSGIPGSGLYFQTLSKKKPASKSHATSARNISHTSTGRIPKSVIDVANYTGLAEYKFIVRINDAGEPELLGPDNNVITDEVLIGLLKKTPQYKEMKPEIKRLQLEFAKETVEEKDQEHRDLIDIFKQCEAVDTYNSFNDELTNLAPETYVLRKYDVPKPTSLSVQFALSEEAEKTIRGFFGVRKRRNEYVVQNYKARYSSEISKQELEEKEFISQEKEKQKIENKRLEKEYKERKRQLELSLAGDPDFIENIALDWLDALKMPFDFSMQLEYREDASTLMVDLDLPEIEDFPDELYYVKTSGVLGKKKRTQSMLKEDYARYVFGLAMFIASNLFNISPLVQVVAISAYTQRRNKEGAVNDDYIYSIKFTRQRFEEKDLSREDPVTFCMGFENRCNQTSTGLFKAIHPFE